MCIVRPFLSALHLPSLFCALRLRSLFCALHLRHCHCFEFISIYVYECMRMHIVCAYNYMWKVLRVCVCMCMYVYKCIISPKLGYRP